MKQLHIVHVYPNEMNTYGDRGNILTLTQRARWHGLEPVIHYHHPGLAFPDVAHLVFGGGGQDSGQGDIQIDILAISDILRQLAESGVPMLMICGMYQLFGHRFITHQNEEIKGIGIFDLETHATEHRLIGNLAAETKEFGILYGFENHSGQTYLGKDQPALGTVIRGNGNNDQEKQEGARMHNIVGTYMHGPLLPLNPVLSDWLITTAAKKAFGSFNPQAIDDPFVAQARAAAQNRQY